MSVRRREPHDPRDHFVRCPSPDCIALKHSSDGLLRVDGVWRWADLGGGVDGVKWAHKPYRTKYGAMMAAKREDAWALRAFAYVRGPYRTENRQGQGWPRGVDGRGWGGVRR